MSELYRRFDAVREENRRLRAEIERIRAEIAEMCNTANLALKDRNEAMEIVRSNIRKGGS